MCTSQNEIVSNNFTPRTAAETDLAYQHLLNTIEYRHEQDIQELAKCLSKKHISVFDTQAMCGMDMTDMTKGMTKRAHRNARDVRELAKRLGTSHINVYNTLAALKEPGTAQALRDMGVTNAQYIGKLCTAVTRSRDAGESDCALYNAFVEKWKAVKADGKTPNARVIWSEVTGF
jgi:hypothetical protein